MEQVRERTLEVLDGIELDPEEPAAGGRLRLRDAARPRVPAQRDDAAAAADGRGLRARRGRPAGRRPSRSPDGPEMVLVEGGGREIGAPATGFAYDNERPRHRVELEPLLDRPHAGHQRRLHRPIMEETGAEPPMYWERDGEGGWVRTAMGRTERGRPAAAGHPRLLARGRRLRALGGQAAADRAGVGGRRSGREPRARQPRPVLLRLRARRRLRATPPRTAARCRCSATSGSGPARTSPPIPASRPSPTPSTRRSSSATSTRCCAAGRGRRAAT